jgi:6-phosphogluconate dehydrogenase
VWLMVPAGDATEDTIRQLGSLLAEEDIIVDGGNSNYQDTLRRSSELSSKGIRLVDAGTSGGVWGLDEGYCLMVGGDEHAVAHVEPALRVLAPAENRGWGHVGPVGSGHFTKMVHNGIEYGMMQAVAEGFAVMEAKKEFDIDLARLAEIWRYGSVIRSWLLDLTASGLQEDQELSEIAPYVADSGEGRWTVKESVDLGVAAPVITLALQMRFNSQDAEGFGNRMLAMMRNAFGGHAIKKAENE